MRWEMFNNSIKEWWERQGFVAHVWVIYIVATVGGVLISGMPLIGGIGKAVAGICMLIFVPFVVVSLFAILLFSKKPDESKKV
jgi:hypothetical protein